MLDLCPQTDFSAARSCETKSMSVDGWGFTASRRRRRSRRTIADRLRDALLDLADGEASVLTHEETAWSSITFSGTRHEVVLDFDGHEAAIAGERFIAELPEHEFRIPGQLVADADVREVEHKFGSQERLIVTAVLLLVEEV